MYLYVVCVIYKYFFGMWSYEALRTLYEVLHWQLKWFVYKFSKYIVYIYSLGFIISVYFFYTKKSSLIIHREHSREVDSWGQTLLSKCSHHSGGQQEGSAQWRAHTAWASKDETGMPEQYLTRTTMYSIKCRAKFSWENIHPICTFQATYRWAEIVYNLLRVCLPVMKP